MTLVGLQMQVPIIHERLERKTLVENAFAAIEPRPLVSRSHKTSDRTSR